MLKIPSALSGPLLYRYIYIYIYIYIYSGKRQDFGGVLVYFIGSRLESRGGVWGGEMGSIRNPRDRAQPPSAVPTATMPSHLGGLGPHLGPKIVASRRYVVQE